MPSSSASPETAQAPYSLRLLDTAAYARVRLRPQSRLMVALAAGFGAEIVFARMSGATARAVAVSTGQPWASNPVAPIAWLGGRAEWPAYRGLLLFGEIGATIALTSSALYDPSNACACSAITTPRAHAALGVGLAWSAL
jgi:hypothetical protein